MGTRYYVHYTLLSGPANNLTLNSGRTYKSFDTREMADKAVAHLHTRNGHLELLEQFRRDPALKDQELRITEVHVREVED
jgi:hypothetical protein